MRGFSFIVLIVLFGFSSCFDDKVIFEDIEEFTGYGWEKDHRSAFVFDITDTTILYDISVFIRHSELYAWSNIWLMVYTTFPDGDIIEQRIEVELADKTGKWHGTCSGDLCAYTIAIQKNALFKNAGTYRLGFEQIMRDDKLKGILNFGLIVSEAVPQEEE